MAMVGLMPACPDLSTAESFGQTPLCCAAQNWRKGVVISLLGWSGVDPNRPDNDSPTPVFGATWKRNKGVVKILRGRHDVNPDKPGNDSQTRLYCAAWKGHKGVVKIIWRRDDINLTNRIATVKPGSLVLFGKGMREW